METKKSSRADLERKKILFLQSGLIVSLGLALAAFEWRSPDTGEIDLTKGTVIHFDEDIFSVTTPHPTLPAPVVPRPATIFNLVDNTAEVEDITPPDFGDNPEDINQVYTQVVKPVLPDETSPDNEEIFRVVETAPEFPGGVEALYNFMNDNIEYPRTAREIGVTGTVYVTFVIEKDGSVSNVKVLRGIGSGCDEEAVRVISLMPKWSPGMQRTKPVRVSFNMPIAFKLKDA